jgi:hypothetical protein
MKREVEYPNITCDSHPGVVEPGYVICRHVKGPLDVAHFEAASGTDMGIVACAICHRKYEDGEYAFSNFTVACASSIREQGLDRLLLGGIQ